MFNIEMVGPHQTMMTVKNLIDIIIQITTIEIHKDNDTREKKGQSVVRIGHKVFVVI